MGRNSNCGPNGCSKALRIALKSHCKLVECDVKNKTDEIIGFIRHHCSGKYTKVFKQVAMISLLLNQNHPFGQYALSFNYYFFKSLCDNRFDHFQMLCTSKLEDLYPEIFDNPYLVNERSLMASRVKSAIAKVCDAICCNHDDPFHDITLPPSFSVKRVGCDNGQLERCEGSRSEYERGACKQVEYDICYDYHCNLIEYKVGNYRNQISIKEVAECLARCSQYPVNPISGTTMTLQEKEFLSRKLCMEIGCIKHFLHIEYKKCGYKPIQ